MHIMLMVIPTMYIFLLCIFFSQKRHLFEKEPQLPRYFYPQKSNNVFFSLLRHNTHYGGIYKNIWAETLDMMLVLWDS